MCVCYALYIPVATGSSITKMHAHRWQNSTHTVHHGAAEWRNETENRDMKNNLLFTTKRGIIIMMGTEWHAGHIHSHTHTQQRHNHKCVCSLIDGIRWKPCTMRPVDAANARWNRKNVEDRISNEIMNFVFFFRLVGCLRLRRTELYVRLGVSLYIQRRSVAINS